MSAGLRRAIGWLTPVLGALATFLAAAPMWHAFPTTTVVALSVLAAAVPSALTVWASRTGRSIAWSAGLSAVALVIALLGVVLREPLGVGDVLRGIGEGPVRLLSESLPISTPRWVQVVPFVLTWLTAAVSTELLLRARRSGAAWAALTWVTSYVVAYLLTVSDGTAQLGWACALLAVIGVIVFARHWVASSDHGASSQVAEAEYAASDPLPVRLLVEGALLLVGVTVVCALVVPTLPGLTGSPVVPKRTPSQRSAAPIIPTATVAELRAQHATTPYFDFSADAPTNGYVSFASLDAYNGDTWNFDATFRPTGGAVPALAAPSGSGAAPDGLVHAVVQHYGVVSAPPFGWMPYLERPVQVSGVTVDADSNSGMVIPQQPLQVGQAYTVTSQVTPLTLASLRGTQLQLPLQSSPDPADATVPLDLQTDLKDILLDLGGEMSGQSTPTATLAYLQALDSAFVHDFSQISTASAGVGTSVAEIADDTLAKRRGTPEQYATVFALLARYLNVPARVVTGFRVTGPGTEETTPNRVYALSAREAWTWVEVPVAGLGWVVVDPTPTSVRPPVVPSSGATTTTTTSPTPNAAVNQTGTGHALARPVRHQARSSGSSTWLVVLIGVLAAGLVFLVQFRMRAALRRRRRQRGEPARRVVGAWAESLDLLGNLRVAEVSALTSSEVGAVVGDRYGPAARDQVGRIGDLADTAIFSTTASITEADADACWRAYGELRKESRSGLRPAQRAMASLR